MSIYAKLSFKKMPVKCGNCLYNEAEVTDNRYCTYYCGLVKTLTNKDSKLSTCPLVEISEKEEKTK